MKFNKKEIIASVILVTSIVVSGIGSYSFKATADEETLSQVKQQLQEKDKELENKIEETSTKDKEIEELNKKIKEQEESINKLNSDLTEAKKTEKQDIKEVKQYSGDGDKEVIKKANEIADKKIKEKEEAEKKAREEAKKNNAKDSPYSKDKNKD